MRDNQHLLVALERPRNWLHEHIMQLLEHPLGVQKHLNVWLQLLTQHGPHSAVNVFPRLTNKAAHLIGTHKISQFLPLAHAAKQKSNGLLWWWGRGQQRLELRLQPCVHVQHLLLIIFELFAGCLQILTFRFLTFALRHRAL